MRPALDTTGDRILQPAFAAFATHNAQNYQEEVSVP